MIITKYFNAEKDQKFYNMGSFRLGTLISYGSGEEGCGDRFSDVCEGKAKTDYGQAGDKIDNLIIGGASIGSLVSVPPAPPGTPLYDLWKEKPAAISYQSRFDANVFCASLGPYSPAQHRVMRFGHDDPDEPYQGCPSLTGWAEIDVGKFIRALTRWVMKVSEYPKIRSGEEVGFLMAKEVSYDKAAQKRPIEDARKADELTEEMIDRAVFHKPKKYAPEREFRIAVSMHPLHHTSKTEPIYPISFALKRSIIRKGKVGF
ncbi:hypothetical protein [Cypionkella sp.]|uniref:hypothetical protein n=1 Tax=Cypionkella sp. TaxID=2811411 RepID=UPI002AB92FF6|nr:hypothetical protein [Cypionkella sp.]MDZ4395943.1 hypothetical protein [Cypionkella sp.]